MKHEAGFTLIEVIFVLAVLSVLILLSAPLKSSVLETKTEETFLNTLEMDLLFMQSMASNSKSIYKMSFAVPGYYTIKHRDKLFRERKIPEGWRINTRTFKEVITFNESGNLRKSGTFAIHTLNEHYNVICPLGKGRCYIEKQ
ncbi:competence protein ComGD [Lentibacillus persicus]|uniref:Competence protein ComGD n=1 Tax=Lentibacillus persicus TaxID=640948 RepID=A0A1I1T5B4_9BACI|nr:competence type IV pilus minor pilin ComGD [Lentibacillus persicus]SFD53811.1 competence protein ComGD [Lentibacillus persicus]